MKSLLIALLRALRILPYKHWIGVVVRYHPDDPPSTGPHFDNAIGGAKMLIENTKTHQKYYAVTGEDGYFAIEVPLGDYKITALHPEYFNDVRVCTITREQGKYVIFRELRKKPAWVLKEEAS